MRLTTAALAALIAIAFTAPTYAHKRCDAHQNGQYVMGKCIAHGSDRDHSKGNKPEPQDDTGSGSETPAG